MADEYEARIEALRRRELADEPLTTAERGELAEYYRRLDEAEARILAPALERMDREISRQQQALVRLEALRDRHRERLSHVQSARLTSRQ